VWAPGTPPPTSRRPLGGARGGRKTAGHGRKASCRLVEESINAASYTRPRTLDGNARSKPSPGRTRRVPLLLVSFDAEINACTAVRVFEQIDAMTRCSSGEQRTTSSTSRRNPDMTSTRRSGSRSFIEAVRQSAGNHRYSEEQGINKLSEEVALAVRAQFGVDARTSRRGMPTSVRRGILAPHARARRVGRTALVTSPCTRSPMGNDPRGAGVNTVRMGPDQTSSRTWQQRVRQAWHEGPDPRGCTSFTTNHGPHASTSNS